MNGMNDLQWYDWFRLVTAALALIAAYRLGRVVNRRMSTYSSQVRQFVVVLFASLFLVFEGALEATYDNTRLTWRSLIQFIVAIVTLTATRRSDEPLQKH